MAENISETLPAGYMITRTGTYLMPNRPTGDGEPPVEPTLICHSPCYVQALAATDGDSRTWYRVIVFRDFDKRKCELHIPESLFTGNTSALIQKLADSGLPIVHGKGKEIAKYLGSFLPTKRVVLTRRTGFTEDGQCFVLSDKAILGRQGERRIKFRPEQFCPATSTITSNGTLAEYSQKVLTPAIGNPLMIFVIVFALFSVLVRFLRVDNGGIHLSGPTSRGKSTLLQIAASVFGIGADPNRARDSYIQRWSMTSNAAEALAAAFSEKLLCLDELDAFTGDLGPLLYFFAGGRGKAAMSSDRTLQEQRSWHSCILSSGEKTLREMIAQQGKKAMGGQFARFIEVPVGDNIFVATGGLSAAEFAEQQKVDCADVYGLLGPAFIDRLLADLTSAEDSRLTVDDLQSNHEIFSRQLTLPGMRPEHQRAVRRLAGAWLAGELAIHFELVPFSTDDVRDGVLHVRDLWLREADGQLFLGRALQNLQTFIRDHETSFGCITDPTVTEAAVPAFLHPRRNMYLFTPAQLSAATGGIPAVDIARELRNNSYLITHESNRLTTKHPLASQSGAKVNLYAVRTAFLNARLTPKRIDLTPEIEPEATAVEIDNLDDLQ